MTIWDTLTDVSVDIGLVILGIFIGTLLWNLDRKELVKWRKQLR